MLECADLCSLWRLECADLCSLWRLQNAQSWQSYLSVQFYLCCAFCLVLVSARLSLTRLMWDILYVVHISDLDTVCLRHNLIH